VFVVLIRGYQIAISPLSGPHCRFHPTCSSYALDALSLYGGLHGGWLALRRVLRCHPFHAGGFDPVPLPPARVDEHVGPVLGVSGDSRNRRDTGVSRLSAGHSAQRRRAEG